MATTTRKKSTTKAAAAVATAKKKAAPAPAKKAAPRKYSPDAGAKVGEVLDEMKHGTLRSGGSGEKVTDRKQAIAIGLSEARRDGAKVPPSSKARKKS
ncbi:MAG: hypothetical protein NVSMB19_17900 [Vulcanimicrobiaceae bacterium]